MAKRGYHHGNLRAALIEATLDLIAEAGPQGFTLAEAAKRAGVSAAAPYRHFAGREDLLAAVALEGFALFADLLERSWNGGRPSPLRALKALGRAYLAFARQHPGHYMAMFASGICPGTAPELAAQAERARKVLLVAAEQLSASLPPDRRPPPAIFAAHIRALSHGVVELFARSSPDAQAPFDAESLLDSGVQTYLRGLGLIDAEN